jgi:hypothetical protein
VTRKAQRSNKQLYLILAAGVAAFMLMSCAVMTLGVGIMYGRGILPGVHAGGIALGGLSQTEAAQTLASEWSAVRLTDGQRAWRYEAADLGLTMDANATAKAAYEQGRSNLGNALAGLIGHVDTQPVINVDTTTLQNTLTTNADQFAQPAVNAGVKLVNGSVTTTPSIASPCFAKSAAHFAASCRVSTAPYFESASVSAITSAPAASSAAFIS